MAIQLIDDGTLDTVLQCTVCGVEFRFNREDYPDPAMQQVDWEREYQLWIKEQIAVVEDEHDCHDVAFENLPQPELEDIDYERINDHAD